MSKRHLFNEMDTKRDIQYALRKMYIESQDRENILFLCISHIYFAPNCPNNRTCSLFNENKY